MVKAISQLDATGFNLRYPKDRQGQFTQDKPLFVNNEALVSYLESFVDQLERIDFKVIRSLSNDGDNERAPRHPTTEATGC